MPTYPSAQNRTNEPCLACVPNSQAWFLGCQTHYRNKQYDHTLARPRYFFGGFRPRQTPKLEDFMYAYYICKTIEFL